MNKRIRYIIIWLSLLISLGGFYILWCRYSLVHIPCIFHKITGLYCPGCGVTRMCLALIRLDLSTAFECNRMVFMILPVAFPMVVWQLNRYIQIGNTRFTKWQKSLIWLMVVSLILFGILRNMPAFYFLRPVEIN